MTKILFLTTSHHDLDDRILYHQAIYLSQKGHKVKICSLSIDNHTTVEGVELESYNILNHSIEEKSNVLYSVCENYNPSIVICSEPLAVIAANRYKKKHKSAILYDITEWYPSARMLSKYSGIMKPVHAIKFFIIQLYAGYCSDFFIFGEDTKKFPLAWFFPFKKNKTIPYYPSEKYITKEVKPLKKNEITLCYTGNLSKEKGIENFLAVAQLLAQNNPNILVKVTIIGRARNNEEERYFENLIQKHQIQNLEYKKEVPFIDFGHSFIEADLCFDLRTISIENHHCLPIKLFYYMAAGKPVIYSQLKAIKTHLDVEEFGYLVDPENTPQIVGKIENYIKNPILHQKHADLAKKLFLEKYNWELLSPSFYEIVSLALEKTKQ